VYGGTGTDPAPPHHIAAVYDYAVTQTAADTVPFLVMELVVGTPLTAVLPTTRRCPGGGPPIIAAQTAAALAAADERGIIYRDIAAGKILLTPGGVEVIDFGICAANQANPSGGGYPRGTPAYPAPERIRGHPDACASDVQSVASCVAAIPVAPPAPTAVLQLAMCSDGQSRETRSAG